MVSNPFVGPDCSLQSVLDFCAQSQHVTEIRRLSTEVAAASATRSLTRNLRLAFAVLSKMHEANLKVPPTYKQSRRASDGYVIHAFTFYTEGPDVYTAYADKTGILITKGSMVMRCMHSQKQHMLISDAMPTARELREFEEEIIPWFNQFMTGFRSHARCEVPKIVASLLGNVRGKGYARKCSEEVHSSVSQV